METRHDDSDGSDIFWPGYVDATTNLILNLLFLLTILIVAVFMFALELGRTSPTKPDKPPIASTEQNAEVASKSIATPIEENIALKSEIERLEKILEQLSSTEQEAKVTAEATTDSIKNTALKNEIERLKKMLEQLVSAEQDAKVAAKETAVSIEENTALKSEIERLKKILEQRASQDTKFGDPKKSVDVTGIIPKPLNGLDETLASDFELIVRFKDEAVKFTPAEHDQLLESLKPIAESERISVYVEVPAGFSAAKRMGFYRAMAVRNLMIEMKLPKEAINVSVVERKNNANASIVRVRSR